MSLSPSYLHFLSQTHVASLTHILSVNYTPTLHVHTIAYPITDTRVSSESCGGIEWVLIGFQPRLFARNPLFFVLPSTYHPGARIWVAQRLLQLNDPVTSWSGQNQAWTKGGMYKVPRWPLGVWCYPLYSVPYTVPWHALCLVAIQPVPRKPKSTWPTISAACCRTPSGASMICRCRAVDPLWVGSACLLCGKKGICIMYGRYMCNFMPGTVSFSRSSRGSDTRLSNRRLGWINKQHY